MKKDFFYSLYYSNLNTPPPFLYELAVDFSIEKEKVDIKYEKRFIDREQFSEEELEEEGFSLNDDSTIEASLPSAWVSYFQNLVKKNHWKQIEDQSEDYTNNYVQLKSNDSEVLYQELDGIEYELEELLQALVETLEIEAPLSIFIRKNSGGIVQDTELYWSFKNRVFEARNPKNNKKFSWEEGREVLSLFYGTDLSEQQVFKKNIPEGITCVNPGDGLWYKTPHHAVWKDLIQKVLPA